MTRILNAIQQGDTKAAGELLPAVYEELRRLAGYKMAHEAAGHTLQATALVHEAWLRLGADNQQNWQNRAHFLAICAQLMRRILIDFARSRGYKKRGGAMPHLDFDEALVVTSQPDTNLLALDDALNRLALQDARKSRVVELRFFGGLGVKETAEVLKVSTDTVMRDWKLAKVWLLRDLRGGTPHGA